MDSPPGLELTPSIYPRAKILYMPAIQERVPVFEGTFRIRQDLKVSSTAAFSNSLGTEGKTFTITEKFAYQACDSKTCFLPTSVPIQWQVEVLPLDRQRAPEFGTSSVRYATLEPIGVPVILADGRTCAGGNPSANSLPSFTGVPQASSRITAGCLRQEDEQHVVDLLDQERGDAQAQSSSRDVE